MSAFVIAACIALAVLAAGIKGYLLHRWIDANVPQLGAQLPTDLGAGLGLAIGILIVVYCF